MNKNNYHLLAIILGGIVLRALVFSGYQSGDDAAYIARAFAYSEGDFSPPYSHWGSRLLPVILTAFSFFIFGVNDFATALFPFVFSIGGILVAYLIGRQVADSKVGLIAAFFMAIFPMDVLFASQLFPYSFLSCLCSLSLYLFLKGEENERLAWFFLAGFALGLAYLSRITALYSLLFFGLYAIWHRDLFHRKYMVMAAGFISVALVEALVGYLQSGDVLLRLHILMDKKHVGPDIVQGAQTVAVAVVEKAQSATASSLDIQWILEPFIRPIVEQEIGIYFLLLWPIVIYQLFWGRSRGVRILLLWIVPAFIYISYGTTSPTDYSPLRRLPRYLSSIIIPCMVLIAYQLSTLKARNFSILAGGALTTFSLLALAIDNSPHVVERERALASYIAGHPNEKYIVPRSVYYDLLYFNGFTVPENVTLYVNDNDVSDTLKRIRITTSDIRETRSLANTCGYIIVKQGKYIGHNMADDPSFVNLEAFSKTDRLYDQLKESPAVIYLLGFVRDKKRMDMLKEPSASDIVLYRNNC